MIDETDLVHLRRSVELARTALDSGDEPFGSVLVSAAADAWVGLGRVVCTSSSAHLRG